jgi:glycerol dehydrogenase-like iron-containing ADH family enzyme
MGLIRGDQNPPLHGEKVGVSVLMALRVCQWLKRDEINWQNAYRLAASFDTMAWKDEIRRVYGRAAHWVLDLWPDENPAERTRLITCVKDNWKDIKNILNKTVKVCELETDLRRMDCRTKPEDLGIPAEDITAAICHAHRIRRRFTVLRLADVLGLLPEYTMN